MTTDRPRAVLFACNLNSIRSPMAAGLLRRRYGDDVAVQSCAIFEGGYLDPFMVHVMREVGVEMDEHEPRLLDELGDSAFDMIIALSPESYRQSSRHERAQDALVEFWPIRDPTVEAGTREARLAAYREVRDTIDAKIRSRFGPVLGPS